MAEIGGPKALSFSSRMARINPPQPVRPPRKRRGFTLIEAIAAVALVAIGVTSAMGGLAAMAKTDRLLMQREEMQRLAVQKYGEIIATGQIETADLSGDFTEQNIDEYEWNAAVEPSGEENLEILTVTVSPTGVADGPQATVDGLVFKPPVEGGTQ
jgi:prepilin-type N-terminal cleavage/methylation domain-containing protein